MFSKGAEKSSNFEVFPAKRASFENIRLLILPSLISARFSSPQDGLLPIYLNLLQDGIYSLSIKFVCMERKKSVGIWIRMNTEDQAKGESPEHHEKIARLHAEAKGWDVKVVHQDCMIKTGFS